MGGGRGGLPDMKRGGGLPDMKRGGGQSTSGPIYEKWGGGGGAGNSRQVHYKKWGGGGGGGQTVSGPEASQAGTHTT